MKIMIVDDNAQMRETIKSILAAEDNDFHQCSSGREAIDSYKQYRPDWVLMDICMEKLDGFRTTQEIKTIDSEAKVVIVTNYDDAEFRAEAKRLGTNGYVLKENLIKLRGILKTTY